MAEKNLTLGRGELWFAKYLPNTQTPGGERYIGNSPEFSATIESETLDHMDSDHGVGEKDESIPLSTNRSGSFVTDNIDPENVALFFFGSKTVLSVTGATITDEPIAAATVAQGLTYQVGVTAGNPSGARDVDTTTPVVIKDAVTPATIYVLGADYTFDYVLGRLTIVEGGDIEDGTGLTITYTTKTSKRERIISGSAAIQGALRYIAFNPAGKNYDWYMPYVKLSPNGDYNLKGDEWQQIPFTVEILKKSGLEALYIDGRAYV